MNPKMIIETLLVILVTLMAALLAVRWASYFLKKSSKKWDIDLTLIQVVNDIIKYSVYLIALSIILRELGIDITAIAVSLGIVGVAVGFASRDIISNFISGMFILADKSFRVGDIIEVSGHKGKVEKVGFRTTTIKTPDARVITIPNSSFAKNPYLNYTADEKRRVELRVTLDYKVDIEKFEFMAREAVIGVEGILKEPEPKLIVLEFADTGIITKFTAWVGEPARAAYYKSIMATLIKDILREL